MRLGPSVPSGMSCAGLPEGARVASVEIHRLVPHVSNAVIYVLTGRYYSAAASRTDFRNSFQYIGEDLSDDGEEQGVPGGGRVFLRIRSPRV